MATFILGLGDDLNGLAPLVLVVSASGVSLSWHITVVCAVVVTSGDGLKRLEANEIDREDVLGISYPEDDRDEVVTFAVLL